MTHIPAEKMRFLLGFAIFCIFSGVPCARAGSAATAPAKRPQSQTPLIESVNGSDLFGSYCAACHGVNGKGDGPVAVALKTKVPDLTTLSKRNKGVFPAARVRNVITGDKVLRRMAHERCPFGDPFSIRWNETRISEM
jgi:hypothetical protein